MINYELANLFKKNSIDKQLSIVTDDKTTNITNVELHQEKFELTESLCSEDELTFGCCEAACLKFTISNIFLPMKSKWITVKTTLNNNANKPFTWGRYKVYSDTPTADRTCRDIVAYDALYDIINTDVVSWYNTILPKNDSTVTLKVFRDSFFKKFNIVQADTELVNDNMIVEKTIQPEELSGATVINCICEINGCFGHMGRDGKFHYIYLEQEIQGLYPRNDLYPSNTLYPKDPKSIHIGKNMYITAQYEDYIVKSIDKLQIRQEENDIGVIVGNGNNAYVIQDNFLVYGKGSSELNNIANNIYKKITKITYRPFAADCKGDPCIEVGDAVRLPTKYELIESYVLKRTISGIQALRDNIESTGDESRPTEVNSVHKSIIQLKGKTNVLTRTIEETNSKIVDVESGLSSEINQTATDIRAEVKNTADGLSSSIQQNAESIATEVKRANEAEGNLSTKITQTAESITLNVSRTYETQKNAAKTKEDLETSITQTANGITSEVSRILQSYSTTDKMNSAISQTAANINTEVSKKVNGNEIISSINQSAEEISIKANKIDFNGAVTANGNFKIGLDGSMEALAGLIGMWQIFDGYLRYVVGENAQALLSPDEILISRTAGANFHAYPGILYMQNDGGEAVFSVNLENGVFQFGNDDRAFQIDCKQGAINLVGDWDTPW